MNRTYATVGSWHYRPSARGFTVYEFNPETAELTLVEHGFDDASIGSQALNGARGIVYACDERGSRRGEVGGGGYVLTLRIDPDAGKPTLLGEQPSLGTEPSHICLDRSGRYALVVHHTDGGHVTQLEKDENGRYESHVAYDDAAIVLFPLGPDGVLGPACDVSIQKGEGSGAHAQAKLHSVTSDPSGDIYMICDKGTDRIYAYAVNREAGKLVQTGELRAPDGYHPRYGAFHPTLPLYYFNNEAAPRLCAVRYDGKGESLSLAYDVPVQKSQDEGMPSEASDLLMSADGRALYLSDRGSNRICVFGLDDKGEPTLRQCVDCGGKNPRGLCFSLDGRFLLAANSDTENIAVFTVRQDGLLTLYRDDQKASCPANICMYRP